jgi:hypothetical protein
MAQVLRRILDFEKILFVPKIGKVDVQNSRYRLDAQEKYAIKTNQAKYVGATVSR